MFRQHLFWIVYCYLVHLVSLHHIQWQIQEDTPPPLPSQSKFSVFHKDLPLSSFCYKKVIKFDHVCNKFLKCLQNQIENYLPTALRVIITMFMKRTCSEITASTTELDGRTLLDQHPSLVRNTYFYISLHTKIPRTNKTETNQNLLIDFPPWNHQCFLRLQTSFVALVVLPSLVVLRFPTRKVTKVC